MLKRTLFALVGVVAALSIGAAGAYFTAQVQVADSVIRAGSVAISAVPTSAPLSIAALAPGQTETRPLTVVNDGALPCDVTVSAKKSAGVTEFYNELTAHVTCDGTELYDGELAALKTTPLRLAPTARGELHFDVALPAEASDTVAGDYAKVTLVVDAEQAH